MISHVDDHALPRPTATDAIAVTDATLSRVETVMNLLLLASVSTASIRGAANSDHDRRQAALVSEALDEALTEQRLIWIELASSLCA